MATRLLPGTSLAAAFPAPAEPPTLSSLESAFELQEYISLLLRSDVHNVTRLVELPTSSNGEEIDKWIWIYEQMRRLVQDMNHPLITSLQVECTPTSCPEMKAVEWRYLCSAHGASQTTMGNCCAIDYTLHTMDHSTALLNSSRNFPSRLSVPSTSERLFPAIARRLARVFAHAYFHHREAFEESEAEHSVYARFNHMVRTFDLIQPEFLIIPNPGATGDEADIERRIHDLTRTETMVQFEARNLSDNPPALEEEGEQGPAKERPSDGKTLLQRSASSASHEATNAVEEAALTPSPAVLAQSPSLGNVPLPEVSSLPQRRATIRPTPHVNSLVIYPPVTPEEPEAEDETEMDVVDMDIVDDADEARPADVVPAPAAESVGKGPEVEMQLGAETDVASTEVSEALAEAASGRIDEPADETEAEAKTQEEALPAPGEGGASGGAAGESDPKGSDFSAEEQSM